MRKFIIFLSLIYLHLIKFTIIWRKELGKDIGRKNFIWIFWHNRIFLFILFYLRFLRKEKFIALISPSRDGEMLSILSRKIGILPVRGSTGHFSPRTGKDILKYLREGYNLIVIPDGPRGPKYKIKDGLLRMSIITETPVLPLNLQISNYFSFHSWDRFMFPLPFCMGKAVISQPIFIEERNLKKEKKELEKKLRIPV